MSRSTVRQYASHRAEAGLPPAVRPVHDVNGSWRRSTRRSPVQSVSASETGSDPPEAPNASPRVSGAPLRSVSKALPGDDRLAVTLTLGELKTLVRDAVLEVLSEGSDPAPALLDRNGIARAIGVGTSSIDRFRKAGCPVVWIGEAPRFELSDVLAWLRGRGEP